MIEATREESPHNAGHFFGCVEVALGHECEAMVLYALGAGVHVSPTLLIPFHPKPDLKEADTASSQARITLGDLSQIHAALSDLIAPATPRAITLMYEEKAKHPRLSAFGPVPIVRQLLLVACLSLTAMLLLALSPHINPDSMQHDLLEGSGVNLLICEMFLVSASALGSSFAALFKLNRFITQGTYDPRYSSTYWIQLALGIIAGVVLSQIIFHTMEGSNGSTRHRAFDQPILALIGGFSAALVYRILNRILSGIEVIFGNDAQSGNATADLQERRLQQTSTRSSTTGSTQARPSGVQAAESVPGARSPVRQAEPAAGATAQPVKPPLPSNVRRSPPLTAHLQTPLHPEAPPIRMPAIELVELQTADGPVVASDAD